MAAKMCRVCTTRRVSAGDAASVGMCEPCYDYAGWENTHSDYGHDAYANGTYVPETTERAVDLINEMELCPVCHPELRTDLSAAKVGHTNTATKGPHRSHAACGHPRTPKARAACRKAGGPGVVSDAPTAQDIADAQAEGAAEFKASTPKLSAKATLIAEVRMYAVEHYNDPAPAAWDVVVEATDDDELAGMIGGARTVKGAIGNVKRELAPYAEKRADIQNTAF